MIEKRPLSDMPKEEFEAVVDAYIERETKDTGELDAPLFYEALQEMVAADAAVEEIEVEGKIIDNQLVLDLPKEWESAEYGGDISILFGERRVAVKLIDEHIQPTAQ
jgi:hypothetical protein